MLWKKKSYIIGKPVCFPFKWCHTCKEHANVGWAAELSVWVAVRRCQCASSPSHRFPGELLRCGGARGGRVNKWEMLDSSCTHKSAHRIVVTFTFFFVVVMCWICCIEGRETCCSWRRRGTSRVSERRDSHCQFSTTSLPQLAHHLVASLIGYFIPSNMFAPTFACAHRQT